jgi:hypothetical protein
MSSSLERRLAKLEGEIAPDTVLTVAGSEAEISRRVKQLRDEGYQGLIKPFLMRLIIVSPSPRDQAGNIIGQAPPPTILDENGIEIPLVDAKPDDEIESRLRALCQPTSGNSARLA